MKQSPELKRSGAVEGTAVDNILLDTGCSRTLVRQELVPRSKMLEGEAVAIYCAHGDTVLYPLALVQMVVDGRNMEVKAAVSKNLPMDVLLGTDVPDLPKLLNQESNGKEKLADALAVVTRAQGKRQQCEEKQAQQRELESGASCTGVENDEWMSTIDEGLFEGGRSRVRKTRSQKRMERQAHARATAVAEEEPLEPGGEIGPAAHPLHIVKCPRHLQGSRHLSSSMAGPFEGLWTFCVSRGKARKRQMKVYMWSHTSCQSVRRWRACRNWPDKTCCHLRKLRNDGTIRRLEKGVSSQESRC